MTEFDNPAGATADVRLPTHDSPACILTVVSHTGNYLVKNSLLSPGILALTSLTVRTRNIVELTTVSWDPGSDFLNFPHKKLSSEELTSASWDLPLTSLTSCTRNYLVKNSLLSPGSWL